VTRLPTPLGVVEVRRERRRCVICKPEGAETLAGVRHPFT
jgi:hypothetical protein